VNLHFLLKGDYVTFGYLPSQFRLSVADRSVTFSHPTQPVEIFGNVSTPCCSQPSLTFVPNFTEIVSGEPLRQWLNAKGVANYSNIGRIEGYVSALMQDTASGTIND